jgi:protein phosphatase
VQPVIRIPDPALVVLVGAAGSGKSTLAARLFADTPDAILSSDRFRARITGDEADQRVTRAAFAILHRELERRLTQRLTTVVDATSVTPFARSGLVRRAAAHGIPTIAIVLDLGRDVVQARNAARVGRVVPPAAVERQLAELAASLRPGRLDTEGFAAVHIVRTPAELDGLAIAREPAPDA